MGHQLQSYESRLIRGLGLTQKQAAEFLERLVPTVALGDVTGFEASDAFFQRPLFGTHASTAVAAQTGKLQLFNPLGSGVDVILELAIIRSAAAANVSYAVHDTAFATEVQTKGFRDRRLTGLPASELRTLTDASAPGTEVGLVLLAATPSEIVPLDVLLSPGRGFHFRNQTVNNVMNVTWFGFEQSRE